MKMTLVWFLSFVSIPIAWGQELEDVKKVRPPVVQEIEFPPGAEVVIPKDAIQLGGGVQLDDVVVWQGVDGFQVFGGGPELGKTKRDELSKHIAIRLSGFRRSCGINDVQFKKLELISKGVIDRHMEKIDAYQKSNEQLLEDELNADNVFAFAGLTVAEVDLADATAEADDEESEEIAQVDEDPVGLKNVVVDIAAGVPAPAIQGQIMRWGVPGLASAAALSAEEVMEKDPVWQKSISKILTPEQVAAYEESEKKRRAFKVRAVVTELILEFDETLLFSDEQRDSLEDLLIGEMTSKDGDRSTEVLRALAASLATELGPSALKSILDDAQIASWKDCAKAQSGAHRLGQFQFNQVPGQRIRLRGAEK